jgi:hypothetical protein
MASKEQKVAEAIAELTESHWFNPAIMGRILSDQPIYTLDKIMDMVKWIIHYQNQRYKVEQVAGRTSEGLLLAHELDTQIKNMGGNNPGLLNKRDTNALIDLI